MTRVLEWFLRWIAGGAFVYAATAKILVPCELAMDIYQYQMAPGVLINIGAIILPYVELILGICLIAGLAPRGAALGITVILLFFMVILSVNLIRGIEFECGCFGDVENDICQKVALSFQADHPDMDRVTFVRIRTGCDIVRDLILVACSLGALLLMQRRMNNSRRIRTL
ncbi:MAG TPA: MauE/DoxX family redox-associated membrane protein [bacterium]|nr:MauE/DoxX family redox-associated membrane protein [bacterium]